MILYNNLNKYVYVKFNKIINILILDLLKVLYNKEWIINSLL